MDYYYFSMLGKVGLKITLPTPTNLFFKLYSTVDNFKR